MGSAGKNNKRSGKVRKARYKKQWRGLEEQLHRLPMFFNRNHVLALRIDGMTTGSVDELLISMAKAGRILEGEIRSPRQYKRLPPAKADSDGIEIPVELQPFYSNIEAIRVIMRDAAASTLEGALLVESFEEAFVGRVGVKPSKSEMAILLAQYVQMKWIIQAEDADFYHFTASGAEQFLSEDPEQKPKPGSATTANRPSKDAQAKPKSGLPARRQTEAPSHIQSTFRPRPRRELNVPRLVPPTPKPDAAAYRESVGGMTADGGRVVAQPAGTLRSPVRAAATSDFGYFARLAGSHNQETVATDSTTAASPEQGARKLGKKTKAKSAQPTKIGLAEGLQRLHNNASKAVLELLSVVSLDELRLHRDDIPEDAPEPPKCKCGAPAIISELCVVDLFHAVGDSYQVAIVRLQEAQFELPRQWATPQAMRATIARLEKGEPPEDAASASNGHPISHRRSPAEIEEITTKVLVFIQKQNGEEVSGAQIAKALGVKTTDLTVPLVKLKEANQIKQTGAKGGARYSIK